MRGKGVMRVTQLRDRVTVPISGLRFLYVTVDACMTLVTRRLKTFRFMLVGNCASATYMGRRGYQRIEIALPVTITGLDT